MEGYRGRPRRGTVYREIWRVQEFGGYKTEVRERIEERERQTLRNKVKEEKHLGICGGLREDSGMKTYLHGPTDYAKKLKLRFRAGDLDLPRRRKRYTSSREEENVTTDMCPRGTTVESRIRVVGECEKYKEERDALEEEMR